MPLYYNEKEPGPWAFFSDTTQDYVTPRVPQLFQNISIRLRVRKGMAGTCFLVLEPWPSDRQAAPWDHHTRPGRTWGHGKNSKKSPGRSGPARRRYLRMHFLCSDECFDYFEARFELTFSPLRYFFEIIAGAQRIRYTRRGVKYTIRPADLWHIIPGFETPAWAEGAVMYQIFVDRFRNGDPSNDVLTGEYIYMGKPVIRVADWDRPPSGEGYREFYGGDLQGVIDKLDYLRDLGVEAIYLNPIFLSPSSHKYDTQDYDHIDPHLGRIVKAQGELLYPKYAAGHAKKPEARRAARPGTKRGGAALGEPLPDGQASLLEHREGGWKKTARTGKALAGKKKPGPKTNRNASLYLARVTDPANLEAGDRLFARLVREAHARGIRVILDGVFNHCGSFHRWLDGEGIYERLPEGKKGARASASSPYVSYFRFARDKWPRNDSYEAWWDFRTLPKLNYDHSPELCEEILEIGRKWVRPPFNADGWRLDVAADLGHSREFNHHFWKLFREAVKEANPEAVILAENYMDSQHWLQGDEWDTIMNYEFFMEPVTGFFTGMEKHSDRRFDDLHGDPDAFWREVLYTDREAMPDAAIRISMNELSNHDHSRFLTRTSRAVGRVQELGPEAASEGVSMALMRQAVLLQMTWTGAPTIYYGDEAGLAGFTDPDNRRTYPWGHEDMDLIRYHRALACLRRDSACLRRGSLLRLPDADGILAYARFSGMPEKIQKAMARGPFFVKNKNHSGAARLKGKPPLHQREAYIVLFNINYIQVDYDADVTCAGISPHAELECLLQTGPEGFETSMAGPSLTGPVLKGNDLRQRAGEQEKEENGLRQKDSVPGRGEKGEEAPSLPAVHVRGGRIHLQLPPQSGLLLRYVSSQAPSRHGDDSGA